MQHTILGEKELNWIVVIGCTILMVPIGYSIRDYFDTQQWIPFTISLILGIILFLITRKVFGIIEKKKD